MEVWELILLIVVAVLVLLFLGGLAGNARVNRARERRLRARIAQADHALADARAIDRGWDRAILESAARAALAERRPGAEVERLDLVQVVDLPGTDQDSAVFHAVAGGAEERLELVRSGDTWSAI